MKGILLTMLSAIVFGFAFTLGPLTYGDAGSNPTTLTFLRNLLSIPILYSIWKFIFPHFPVCFCCLQSDFYMLE